MNAFRIFAFTLAVGTCSVGLGQTRTATLKLDFTNNQGPIEMDRISLGEGGLSEYPMWESRVGEIRALHPRLIRLFVQEYYNLLPGPSRYHFDTLDQSVDLIVQTGAKPLMTIAIKPKLLFPVVDQDVVDPNDYGKWEALISHMVTHYKQRGLKGLYWEIANEPDIGEIGGSPYRFKPENYVRYYQHTVAAIHRADPTARVGGPALAGWTSPLLPALIEFCDKEKVQLDFVSWHTYDNDPKRIEHTITTIKAMLAKHPSLHTETILDEWNMALSAPPDNPSLQPAFVVETAWRMKEAGLTYSCYYHIRDYRVQRDRFEPFFSLKGASFMASWWNHMPQYDGLFDYQNVMRPAYFSFQLLSRHTGDRLEAVSDDDSVHAFFSHDNSYENYNLLFWNFSATAVDITLDAQHLPSSLIASRRLLDAASPSGDENVRLRPLADVSLTQEAPTARIHLEPYGVETWSLEKPEN